MMAGWGAARALLLVLLTGWSYSYPVNQGTSWAVPPPSPFSPGTSGGPTTDKLDYSVPAPQFLGAVSRPDYSVPQYQAGELIEEQKTFENGHYDSETKEGGSLPPPPPPPVYPAPPSPGFSGGLVTQGVVPYPLQYPSYDFLFLTGQYPQGTYTQTSKSFEQGRDTWENAHYTGDNAPRTQQAVKQVSIGRGSHGLSVNWTTVALVYVVVNRCWADHATGTGLLQLARFSELEINMFPFLFQVG
ncbi:uncharacterized protein LOC117961726 [Etheostoma cragini]|uniref:uncharacterized protein LOC117961726 n=1 Tax=Etheostoma cragini TaxID=417921 RepID=UPI00155DFE01|nr:uncharacterized protein LOC117961726 [Etheostoma cragini]